MEVKLLILAIDVKLNFFSSNIDACIHSAEEGLLKDEGCLLVVIHVQYHELDRDEAITYARWDIFNNPCRVPG